MRKRLTSILVLVGMCAAPAFALAESFQDAPLVDVKCSKKAAADPDSHTRACALGCAGSGFGIVTKDQGFLKFDAEGNAKVLAELKASQKQDHLRVNVSGDVQGDTLKVSSVKLL